MTKEDQIYINLYNELYENGYHSEENLSHSKIFYNNIIAFLSDKEKPSILDIGCSIGNTVKHFQDLNYTCFGVDISEIAINKCKERKIKNCYQSESHNICLPSNNFDAIICTDVLEHVQDHNLENTIKEFYRLIKDNGNCYIRICLNVEQNRKYDNVASKYNIQNLHITIKTKDSWIKMFENYFTIEKYVEQSTSWLSFIAKK